MNPVPPEIASAMAERQLAMISRIAEVVPEAATALAIAVLVAVGGLILSEVRSHVPAPR
jgi:hypothetical protein